VKKKVLFSVIALTMVVLVALPLFGACEPAPPEKDTIRIGIATPLTGPLALVRKLSYSPTYELWVEEVNAKGGIYVEEYGKRLPIEMVVYDDKSDLSMTTRLLEKLILEDKVDFILAPSSTAFLYAAAPIANKHEYILLGAEGGAATLKEIIAGLPYFFSVLNFGDHQMPVLADIFEEVGVKTAAITFNADLHGIEYSQVAVPEFALKGIDVIFVKSHPLGTGDFSLMLKEAKAADVDAFCGFTYPDECILLTAQSMEIGFNPNAFFLTVGPYAPFFRDIFTAQGVEGMMGGGAWNPKSSPGAQEFYDKYVERYGEEPNYWGALMFWSAHQFFEQAIEKAGTLDQKVVRDVMATETFDTAWGPFRFECPVEGGGGLVPAELYPGQIGQWQKNVFEVIDPGAKRTAAPEYPKPAWPAPPK
jgi:branched-chain amino acid transport system substrate-binding protein